jgi:tetratricopeptide (TPR) repeat protein
LTIDPKDANALHALAIIAYDRRNGGQSFDSEKQRAALEQALESDPDHPRALFSLAVTLVEEFGQINEGLAVFDRLFAVDRARVETTTYYRPPGWRFHPNFYVIALEERAEIKSRLKIKDGIDDFNEVIRLAPDYAQAYLGRSHYYLNVARDPIKALADSQKAQELEPNRQEPLMSLVQSLMSLKRYDSLLPIAQQLIERPGTVEGRSYGYHGRYLVYKSQGRHEEAFADGQQWLAHAPYYIPTVKTRLERRGYFSGPHDYDMTEEFLNGFKACIIDPDC